MTITKAAQKILAVGVEILLIIGAVIAFLIYIFYFLDDPINPFSILTIVFIVAALCISRFPKVGIWLSELAINFISALEKVLNEHKTKKNIEKQKNALIKNIENDAHYLAREAVNNAKILLRRFTYAQLRALARENEFSDDFEYNTENGVVYRKPEFQEYVDVLVGRVNFDKILSFAERNNILEHYQFKDSHKRIEQKIIKLQAKITKIKNLKTEEEIKNYLNNSEVSSNEEPPDPLFQKLVKRIKEFRTSQQWPTEEGYHAELQGWLKTDFPEAKVEIQSGSSRPDILVNNVAIEVKGPTMYQQLDTVASKCMRYPTRFNGGLIVVLFDLQVNPWYYNEWYSSLKTTFPNVEVIKK